nr:MAG TPA: hypothetical protein [Caudoviricetes sp.]
MSSRRRRCGPRSKPHHSFEGPLPYPGRGPLNYPNSN